jgi:SNF2 family DNA or RNA helicase
LPGELLYKVEARGEDLLVRIEERGSRRLLYLDTLKALARESDKEVLALLIRLHLQTTRNPETLNFQRICVPAAQKKEILRLLEKTGRVTGDLPKKETVEVPLQLLPKLVLSDANGCFANLWMDYGIETIAFEDFAPTVKHRPRLKKEEAQWEKDLLEAGFTKKIVGDSHYYCPTEKVKETLLLLLDVGWQIVDCRGRTVVRQGKTEVQIGEEGESIVIRGSMQFGDKSVPLNETLQTKMWVSLGENRVGLIEKKPEIEALKLKKNQIGALLPLLDTAKWEENLRAVAEGLSRGAAVETSPPGPSFRGELLPYQQKGVDWLSFLYKWNFSGLLADEMGLGKTVQVLAFLSQVGTNLPTLIVAPTSLLFNWRLEIARFLPEAKQIELISYTQLRMNGPQKEYEVIVLDESTAIKNASTQTARAACKLKGRFRICLNGTPMENSPDEVRSQFAFLLPELDDLKKMRPFILRRRKEEVQIDLPEKIEQIAWVEMGEEQRELYETYRKGFKSEGAERMEILEAILRLRQICADPQLVGGAMGAKLELLLSDVKEVVQQKRKVLIYSQFTSMLQLIRSHFPEALYLDGSTPSEKRGELVKQFQEDPESSIFLLSLKAGGVGLNLTAADYVFLFDPWWNEAVERQAIDRAHRIGQKKTVIAKRYLVLSSIEEKMLQLKEKKQQAADQLLDFEGGSWTEEELLLLLS